MTEGERDMPERIWAETEPYSFSGFDPCWVWHSGPHECEECPTAVVPYVRADLLAEAMRFVEMVAGTALDDDLADDELIYGPDVTAGDVRAARALRRALTEGER